MDCLLIIDGSSLLSTQFFGNLPREILFAKTEEEKEKYYHKIMQTRTGVYTNAVYGFVRTLLKIMREQQPKYLAVTWDVSRDTFRRELYPEYKGNRQETVKPLKEQFILCQQLLGRMGIPQFMDPRYEADDFSGSLASKFENEIPIRIMTKDRDYLQLVNENTKLWMIHTTAKKTEELYKKYHIKQETSGVPDRCFEFDEELVRQEFGVEPASISSLKGLQGDASDNIKGVPGVGEATAIALIAEYKTIDRLYEEIEKADESGKGSLTAYWKEALNIRRSPLGSLTKESDTELVGKKAAFLSRELATIKCDIDLEDVTLEGLKARINTKEAAKAFDELEFKSLRLETEEECGGIYILDTHETIEKPADAEKFVERIISAECRHIGMSLQVLDGNFSGMCLTGIDDAADSESAGMLKKTVSAFIVAGGEISVMCISELQRKIFGAGIKVSCINIKDRLDFVDKKCGGLLFDASIAAYLINPLADSYDCGALAREYLDTPVLPGRGETGEWIQSVTAFHLYTALSDRLRSMEMDTVFSDIEMKLVYTLYNMQKRGIRVNRDALREYGRNLSEGIAKLEQEIYAEVGEEFNINSPKQLGEILFGKLKLPYGKKSKTGSYSTSADILEKLCPEAPVVGKVLEYRQLTKLKSTYADGLDNFIAEDERIHSTFNQTVTATGRISSTDPNLQNIPIRMELGRLIRKVFIPKEGCVFLDADYSQIELRILAHMSGDEKLIEAYNSSQDIHRITASQVFHTPLDEVTPEQRSNAKAVNFGIVYGISSFGLGQGLNISKKEAQKYIDKYFETYPQVKNYLDGLVVFAKDKGYAKTIFGRRRPIPELDSSNFMQRAFGERIAMNSPIQGTAADIIKIAMVRVDNRLIDEGLRSRLLLQIHDELLVETYTDEIEQVKRIMEEEMKNAAKLSVELSVEVMQGNDWYETK